MNKPSGKLAFAYATIASLEEKIARLEATQPAPVAVVLPEKLRNVWLFLDGQTELNGCTFGEKPEGRHNYWWRRELREAIEELTHPSL